MFALLALSLLLAAVAVVLAVRSLASPRQLRRRLAHVERYGLAAQVAPVGAGPAGAPAPSTKRTARETVAELGGRVAPHLGTGYVDRVRRDLLAAGHYDVSPQAFIGTQALVIAGAAGGGLLLSLAAGAGIGVVLLLVAFAAFVGYAVPAATLSRRARGRLQRIDREMPELVDLLVVAIEAGLGLFAALDHASTRMTGPLGDELRLVLREQGLGASTADALGRLAERCQTEGVKTFSRTLVQGERLGVSVGQSMRALAVDMRKRRKADAEEQAQKMPVKLLIPLVFCIFPAMFVVLLFPAAIKTFEGLG